MTTVQLSTTAQLGDTQLRVEGGRLRVPLAKVGTWVHDKYGQVKFTLSDFEDIIDNYRKDTLGFRPYLTYGHPIEELEDSSEFVERARSLDAERKQGDAEDLRIEGDYLIGYFNSNPDTYQLVQEGKYEFSSGEFLHHYRDKDTGEERGTALLRCALTNAPFLPMRQRVLALSEGEQIPQTQTVTVFKLSANELPTEPMQEEARTSPTEVTTSTEQEKPVAPLPAPTVDINQLTQLITEKVASIYQGRVDEMKAGYENVVGEYKSAIETLQGEITNLREQLTNTQQITTAFSTEVSNRARLQREQKLLNEGVSPALIQRFSILADAINGQQRVVKFSTSEGEKESPILDELEGLLVKAVQSNPIEVRQFGQSTPQRETGIEAGIRAEAERIRARKQAITK